MGDKSAIEWTDATWNPVTGCTKVSAGCKHCYAERVFPRAYANDRVDVAIATKTFTRRRTFSDVRCHDDRLDQPLRWRRPRRIFVKMISRSKHAKWWKTAARRMGYSLEFEGVSLVLFPLPNVWLGVSCENQHFANERIPLLLQTPAAVRFISAEPLLGPIDLHSPVLEADSDEYLDWVIVGGESGAGARPFDLAWARAIVQQCQAAGVPVFVKQLGAVPMVTREAWVGAGGVRLLNARNHRRVPTGFEPILLGDRKGGDPSEWPENLRVREFPAVVA